MNKEQKIRLLWAISFVVLFTLGAYCTGRLTLPWMLPHHKYWPGGLAWVDFWCFGVILIVAVAFIYHLFIKFAISYVKNDGQDFFKGSD